MSCCGAPLSPEDADAVSRLVVGRLAAFLKTLRDAGFAVGLAEGRDAAALVEAGHAARPATLRSALKHLVSGRRRDWEAFDGIFDAFFLGTRVRSRSVVSGSTTRPNSPSLKSLMDGPRGTDTAPVADQVPSGDAPDDGGTGEGRMEGASAAEDLAQTDLRRIDDPDQMAAAHAAAERLARAMHARLTRRDLARRRGHRLDLRRTIHRNISHGGVPLSLVKRRRKQKPLRLVVLLDASGSMSMYTSVFLRFVHGVLGAFDEAEAFLFHTRLAHVSDAMKERDAGRALDRLSMMAQGVGGGTRIGDCLARVQPPPRRPGDPLAHLRDDPVRRLRDRRRGQARPRDGGPASPLPAHRLAEPDDRLGGLCAGGGRNQGGAAPCRPLCARPHACRHRRPRTLPRPAVRHR